MVGIVIVSHSHLLAEGVAELARQMGGGEVRLAVAGGLDEPDHPLGTDPTLVMAAIQQVSSPEGVLVLMDLGSAVLSAEMALDLMVPDFPVLLCEAPLVEGAVAAVVQASLGASLEEVADEARRGLAAKVAHLAASVEEAQVSLPPPEEGISVRFIVTNPLGLHARPAARFVGAVGRHDARVTVVNLSSGAGPASGRSLTALAALGVRQGHQIEVRAAGRQAPEVLSALEALATEEFGDRGEKPSPATREPAQPETPAPAPSAAPSDGAFRGQPASPGVAVGEARPLVGTPGNIPIGEVIDPQAAWAELEAALRATRREIQDTRRVARARVGAEEAAIFDAHLLLLEDEDLLAHTRRLVFEHRRHPAAAWQEASEGAAERLRAVGDRYLAERAADIEGVAGRVVAHLMGSHSTPVPEAGIIIAADLTPAETAALDPSLVQAVATAGGGPTSHTAILARGLGIPSVVGLGPAILEVPEGTTLVVDGDRGLVHIDPGPELIEVAHRQARKSQARRVAAQRSAAGPAITQDGTRIEVGANLGSVEATKIAVESGADGVGLLRTEFLFFGREAPPSEDEQFEIYRQIAQDLGGRPLTIRTLDAGGDKTLPYLSRPVEANPFLGVRGMRLGLDRPDLFRDQLRAIYRVAAADPVRIMFPMVGTLDELLAARRLAAEAAGVVGTALDAAEVGLMVEVPAAALVSRHLALHADFFSIGTNDLTQYTMAAERGNPDLAHLADALHPAVLRLIRVTVEGASARGRWVGVCGELAGDPAATALLVGLGVAELSVAVPAVAIVKEAVRATDLTDARRLAERALELPSAREVRELLADPRA